MINLASNNLNDNLLLKNIYIRFTLQILTTMIKSVDGVLGTQTWGDRMVGADESTELV